MTKIFGIIVAGMFTASVVLGIVSLIASDFTDLSAGIQWVQKTYLAEKPSGSLVQPDSPLRHADNITFFRTKEIEGTSLVVTTGIQFSSVDDVIPGKTNSRWCYILYRDGELEKRITLGKQEGKNRPTYEDVSKIPEHELRAVGHSSAQLSKISSSHCFLEGFDPRSSSNRRWSKYARSVFGLANGRSPPNLDPEVQKQFQLIQPNSQGIKRYV